MKSYWGIVNNVLRRADVLVLVLDARNAQDTRNKEIEVKVKAEGKPLIFAVTKSDLVGPEVVDKIRGRLEPSVLVSGKEGLGIDTLIQTIFREAKAAGKEEELIKVGVLGYPNVGKSTLVNALKGREVARVSALSGHTKFVQKVRVHNRLLILDTPGVLPDNKKDFMSRAILGSLDFTHVKEPDTVVISIMVKNPGVIERHYGVEPDTDCEEAIAKIAKKRNILKRGGEPDLIRMSRNILADWHKGNIPLKR